MENKRIRLRRYINHGYIGYYKNNIHKKKTLDTWIQNKCIICKRFLSMKQQKFCKRCKEKGYKISMKLRYLKEREYRRIRAYIWFHSEKLNIGDIIYINNNDKILKVKCE